MRADGFPCRRLPWQVQYKSLNRSVQLPLRPNTLRRGVLHPPDAQSDPLSRRTQHYVWTHPPLTPCSGGRHLLRVADNLSNPTTPLQNPSTKRRFSAPFASSAGYLLLLMVFADARPTIKEKVSFSPPQTAGHLDSDNDSPLWSTHPNSPSTSPPNSFYAQITL